MSIFKGAFLSLIALAFGLVALRAHAQTSLTFTTVDVPGARSTEVTGADIDGNLVGFYVGAKGVSHGFHQVGGKITFINFPGSTGTVATSVDLDSFFIVGWYTDSASVAHGFKLSGKTFKTIDVPDAVWTRALSVNTDGTIVGTYADRTGIVHGFVDKYGKGTFTTLDVPDAPVSEITSIANLGYMAATFVDSSGEEHGFLGAAGTLESEVNFPGAGMTFASGVNDDAEIVGYYGATAAGPFRGFTYVGAEYKSIEVPGATDTRCNGLSDPEELVGRYTDAAGKVHGFTAK